MHLDRILISAIWLPAICLAQVSPLTINLEGTTPTQAVFSYDTGDSTACTVKVAEALTPAVVVHDVDPAIFAGSDQDLTRGWTFTNGTRRYVTIGARTSAAGADGRLYSRALQAATDHNLTVSCAHAAGTLVFTTRNLPLGSTYPDIPPFNAAGFGNYAWPTVDWKNPGKTYVDPMTGLLLKPAHAVNPEGGAGEWGNQPGEFAFRDVFDLHQAWSGTGNVFAGTTSGPFATYSGVGSDPLFLPFPKNSQNTQGTIAGWGSETPIWDDVRLTLYGYGSDANAENRKVLACLAAFYAPGVNQCTGPEIEMTLPAGTAGTVTSPGFPGVSFPGWGLGRYLSKEEAGVPNGDVTVAGSVVTWVDGTYFPLTMPGGVKIKLGSSWYTVGSVDSATQITLAEGGVTLSGNTPYQLGGFGMRIRKKTGVGTINVNTSLAWVWSIDPALPINGVANLCNQQSVTVNYQADGVTAMNPPQQGNLCMVGSQTKVLLLLIPATGETRVLSGLQHTDAGSSSGPQLPFGAFSASDPLTLYGLHGDDVVASQAVRALYKITYNAASCHFKAWSGNNYGFPPAGPGDCMTWTNVTPNSQGRGVITQFQTAVASNPYWDPAVMSNGTLTFGGITGQYAIFSQYFGGPQDSPCFIGIFDLTTGNLIQALDTFGGSSNVRFTGCHTTPGIMVNQWIGIGLVAMGGKNGPGYLSGPFRIKSIDGLSKDGGGTWSADTSMTNVDVGQCTTTDSKMIGLGATGNRCVKIRVSSDVPCSQQPANGDAKKFPCPWNAAQAGPAALQVGDYISDMRPWPGGTVDGKNEKMLITTKKDIGGGNWELELMRWATCDNLQYFGHLSGGELGNTHVNGWMAYMSGTGMCAGAVGWLDVTDPTRTFFLDTSPVSQAHGTLGPAPNGMYATVGEGGNSRIGPIPAQFTMQPAYALNLNTTNFGGVQRTSIADDVESYPNLGQWNASDTEKSFAFDLRHYNPGYGSGPERPAGIWPQTMALAPGTRQLYRIDNYGGVFGKVFPYLAFAGRFLLKDISGPSSAIGDADAWRFCVAYTAGECRPDSNVNDAFMNVPRATLSNNCVVNSYALNSPCFTTPYNYGAWAVQFQITQDDLAGKHYRVLTMGLTGPGRQYQFTSFHVTPDGRWGFLAPGWVDGVRSEPLLVKIPPAPVDDGIDRSSFIPRRVDITPDANSVQARVRFGYAENGSIGSFFCTPRQESCLTDAQVAPFAYEQSDQLTATPCGADGCTIYVPALPGRVLYYRVELLDGSGAVTGAGATQVYAAP